MLRARSKPMRVRYSQFLTMCCLRRALPRGLYTSRTGWDWGLGWLEQAVDAATGS